MKKQILLVDDSVFMLTTTSDMLKGLGYDVTCAKNGLLACRSIEAKRFDMIMTDLNMPGMDGVAFAKQIKSHPNCKFVPIVLLSDEKDQQKIAEAKKVGISTFLSKPLNETRVKSLLQVALSKRGTQRYPVKLEVFYGPDCSYADYVACYSHNVSLGGVFVMTDNPLQPNEKVRVKLYLPDNESPVICQGRVAWVNSSTSSEVLHHPVGMGVEFSSLTDKQALLKFLKEFSLSKMNRQV